MGCKNARQGPDGCGTAPDCALCGAVEAILESQHGEDRVTRECRVSLVEPIGASLDLKVSATAVAADGERFTICVAKDISDQKRLAVLARLFFHDVMNTAGSIQGYTELLGERYLGGKVEFRSGEEAGTTFTITLPKITRQRPSD
jgi:hypothetical protein